MAISRRQFVVGGAVAGAGALVIGVRLSESLAWAQESDAGKKKPAPKKKATTTKKPTDAAKPAAGSSQTPPVQQQGQTKPQ